MSMNKHFQALRVSRNSSGTYDKSGTITMNSPFKDSDFREDKITSSVQNSIRIENYTQATWWYVNDKNSITPIESKLNNGTNYVGIWVLSKRQVNEGHWMKHLGVVVTHIPENQLPGCPDIFGIPSPIFATHEEATMYREKLRAAVIDLHRDAPVLRIHAPLNYPHQHLRILQLGVNYEATVVRSDEIRTVSLEILSGNSDSGWCVHTLRGIAKERFEIVHIDQFTKVVIAVDEPAMTKAKRRLNINKLDAEKALKLELTKELRNEVEVERDAHVVTKRKLTRYEEQHSDVVEMKTAQHKKELEQLKKEELVLKQDEQKEKTKRSVHDTSAAVSKSTAATASASSSLVSTSLTIGASILTIAAIAIPIFSVGAGIVAGIAGGLGKVLGAIGCIFGF